MNRHALISHFLDNMDMLRRGLMSKHVNHRTHTKNCPTRAQLGVLYIIAAEGKLSIKELANRFSMSSSAATQLVESLVKGKLLSRSEDSKDRRKIVITLTSLGTKTLAEARAEHIVSLSKILQPLTTADLVLLHRLQEKVLKNLK